MGSAGPSSLVRLFGYWVALQRTLCVCWWCGLGVDRIVDARVYRIADPPGVPTHAGRVCVVGVLLFVLAY